MAAPVKTPRMLGQPIKRREDPRLITGAGQYLDDITFPGMLHLAVVRSPYAHARVNGIDASAALALPGVVAVYTAKDVEGETTGSLPYEFGWQPFENASLRFIKAIAMPPQEAAALIGEDVANAKVMRSDIARFFKAMQAEFGRLVAFSQESDR